MKGWIQILVANQGCTALPPNLLYLWVILPVQIWCQTKMLHPSAGVDVTSSLRQWSWLSRVAIQFPLCIAMESATR